MSVDARVVCPAPWRELLSRAEIAELLEPRDWRSALSLATDWGLIFCAMAGVARWPNPFTVVVALFVIGARQLGLAVLMHEASHHTLFRNRRVNDGLGSWLAAYPLWSDLHSYRTYHLKHHAHTWTDRDPDLALATPFPITRASFARKVGRDLSGRTGIKFLRFSAGRDFGSGSAAERCSRAIRSPRFRGMLLSNATLLALLSSTGHPGLYLLWVAAYLTTHTLLVRIRAIAEHCMVPDPSSELQNTRTTLANPWERLLLAPNRVNYHLEHHLLMTVPHYNLPRMHALLRDRGGLAGALVERGYASVLRRACSLETGELPHVPQTGA